MSVGLSAVDLSSDILIGRPYGGTAILYRKSLSHKLQTLDTNESRITGIQIDTEIGPVLLLNVYMSTNYGDDLSLESYIDCLSKLHVLILESDTIHTLIVGDFTCSPGSRFFPEFAKFATENYLFTSDLNRLDDVVTFISDDGSKMSWVDHILCSTALDKVINNVIILNDVIVSDHRPISFSVQCAVDFSSESTRANSSSSIVPLWNTYIYIILFVY